jgi:hypothetical protein
MVDVKAERRESWPTAAYGPTRQWRSDRPHKLKEAQATTMRASETSATPFESYSGEGFCSMSTSRGVAATPRTKTDGRDFPRRLGVFLVLALAMLSLQYPAGSLRLYWAWDLVLFALLGHSVVIAVDALCAVCQGKEGTRVRARLVYFFPVEGRGLPQLITLVALVVAVAAAMGLHGLGTPASGLPE